MENNTTPNTPAELFAMQAPNKEAECNHDSEDCDAFADFLLEEVMPEFDPSPYQTVKAIERLLFRLKSYHFDTLHDEEVEMPAWNRLMWEEDFKRLSTALDAVRLIHPD